MLRGYYFKRITEEELENCFPSAIEINKSQLKKGSGKVDAGVYFADTDFLPLRPFSVRLVGECPNKQPDGKCGVHEFKPAACANLDIGHQICNNKRVKRGLSVVEKGLANEARREKRIKELQAFIEELNKS